MVPSPTSKDQHLPTIDSNIHFQPSATNFEDILDIKRKSNLHHFKRSKWDHIEQQEHVTMTKNKSMMDHKRHKLYQHNQDVILQQIQTSRDIKQQTVRLNAQIENTILENDRKMKQIAEQ